MLRGDVEQQGRASEALYVLKSPSRVTRAPGVLSCLPKPGGHLGSARPVAKRRQVAAPDYIGCHKTRMRCPGQLPEQVLTIKCSESEVEFSYAES